MKCNVTKEDTKIKKTAKSPQIEENYFTNIPASIIIMR